MPWFNSREARQIFRSAVPGRFRWEIERIKTLVALARAIFVIWLGAVREESKYPIKDLVPWGLNNIGYHGLASHNPLSYNTKITGVEHSDLREGSDGGPTISDLYRR
jgi:hypothetical protein